ncbi:MAG: hypothetical protein WBM32_16675 [Crocosphaera sp.]
MNTEEKARELMAQEHLTDEQRHQKMVSRAVEVEQAHQEQEIDEKARELLAQQRQEEEAVDEKILQRSVEEIQ